MAKYKTIEKKLVELADESAQASHDVLVVESNVSATNKNVEQNTIDISDNRQGLTETFETSMLNTDDIAALRSGLEEVYEMLLGSEE